jgi:hypothetical protein
MDLTLTKERLVLTRVLRQAGGSAKFNSRF